jgi:hypothetical protein
MIHGQQNVKFCNRKQACLTAGAWYALVFAGSHFNPSSLVLEKEMVTTQLCDGKYNYTVLFSFRCWSAVSTAG